MPIDPNITVPIVFQGTPLAQVWYDAYIEFVGDTELALAAVQADPDYDTYFPGNRREDGSIRWEEGIYRSIEESYSLTIGSYGVNPELFRAHFGEMIAFGTSPDEFAARMDNLYTRVVDASPHITDWYANNLGIEITMEGIMASFMDKNVSDSILNKEITMAEIGGEAASRGFQVVADMADMLFEAGVDDRSEAQQLFASAEAALPVLNVLAARHADPDDDFDLQEFVAAQVLRDPEQMSRMRRLIAKERSTFVTAGGLGGPIAQTQSGQKTGLVSR